jgi:hypothetical protein
VTEASAEWKRAVEELKARIDLHDLAHRLGLERPGGELGNYRSPSHPDKNPSLSIYTKDGRHGWKDHSTDEGGSAVDLVMMVQGVAAAEAIKFLAETYNVRLPSAREQRDEQQPSWREKSLAEHIADRVLAEPELAREYLRSRGLPDAVIDRAIKARSVGFNDYRSKRVAEGQPGHGGPGVAFVVRSLNPGHVVAVDVRYVDAALNGGVKTQCQGEKDGHGWMLEARRLAGAHTVYIVESPINALSVEACAMPNTVAIATRGLSNVQNIDWRVLRGKQVIACMDNDAPFPEGHKRAGERPGPQAAWTLHERLTSLDISCLFVDQEDWEVNDVNDLLQAEGVDGLRAALKKLEGWLIPGLSDKLDAPGKRRLYLPYADLTQYGHYRVRPDFTTLYSMKRTKDETGGETETPSYSDLVGFRVAGISRVTIQGATATTTGKIDQSPTTAFAVTVQVARHGAQLLRRVVKDEKLHSVDFWKQLGPVWNQGPFLRMVNVLERAAHIGQRTAVNFVGLCWREGELVMSEGPDTYFQDPAQQCPYHNLIFPSGPQLEARVVIRAFQETFQRNAAAIPLVWGLGAHLKCMLGFWPHLQMQADKGHGKSTLAAQLELALGMKIYSKEAIKTAFRLITTTAHTSHPVGWEEISANRMEIIDAAVSLLQEAYNFKPSPRGASMLEFVTCAPVMLIGEDVPVRSLIGKLVRTELTGRKGTMIPHDLPSFPVREWLLWLTEQPPAEIRATYKRLSEHALARCVAPKHDEGAYRMVGNYAAILTAWSLLARFAGIDPEEGGFGRDVIAEMNAHVLETSADREPWVWIVETLLSEIAASEYRYPYVWGTHRDAEREDQECLFVRPGHVMDHMARSIALREKWNALPVKSERVFKRQLLASGVVIADDVEKQIEADGAGNKKRVAHMVAISIARLDAFGLSATPVSRSFADSPAPP